MALTEVQKQRKNELRVQKRAAAKAARISTPRDGARESLVSKLVTSVIKSVVQKAKARGRMAQWKLENGDRKRKGDKDYHSATKVAASEAGVTLAEFKESRKEKNAAKPGFNRNEHNKRRRLSDDTFLVVTRLRTRLGEFMKLTNGTKAAGTMQLVGCSKDKLLDHLRAQLPEGETLQQNSIDHIFPMSLYDMTCPDEQRRCMNYTNLRPLKLYGVGGNASIGNTLPALDLARRVSRDCWPASISETDLN